jgi:SH3-like domain-containing protein
MNTLRPIPLAALLVLLAIAARDPSAYGQSTPRPASKPAPILPAPAAPPPAPSPPAPSPQDTEHPAPPATAGLGSVTHQKLPYFMTFRFDDVNLRVGPGTNYPIEWVYRRRDLPVEILLELGDWRKIRDQDAVIGWVRAPSLWKRRSVVVRDADRTLRAQADNASAPVAVLKPGVVAHVHTCPAGGAWCEVEINAYRGWLKREDVYGVYSDEPIEGP